MMPTLSWAGAFARNDCIADCAAASRVGATSAARIDPETSTTRITVARSLGRRNGQLGRATATQRAASAASRRTAGTWRLQLRPVPPIAASTSRFEYVTAYRVGRRWTIQ